MPAEAINVLYILRHEHVQRTGMREAKHIGIYTSKNLAQDAQQRSAQLQGFIDHPKHFFIDRVEVDIDLWPEGFTAGERQDRNLAD
ncbi:MAG: hypothetical protein RJB62_1711 [Pseudomonadota bacterium]|jgi:hypothetical protein